MIKEPRRGILTKKSLNLEGVAMEAGRFNEVGAYTVPAGMAVEVGFGVQSGQDEAQGRIFIDLKPATGSFDGLVRVQLLDAQKRPLETLFESRTELLRQGATDRTKQISLPEVGAIARENNIIALEVNPDTNATISVAASTILIDTTTYTDREPVTVA